MRALPGPVAVTAAAVLTPLADDLDGFTAALLAGRSAVTLHGEEEDTGALPAAALDGFDLASWAARHLAGDEVTAARLRKVAGRAALPARTAACVALRAVRDAHLTEEQLADGTALIVAGSNLALAHQAATVLGHDRAPGRLRASYALTHLDVDTVGAVSELTGIRGEGWALGGASASGTLALIQAARTVAAGWAERALVVAPVAELSPVETEALRRTGAMAHEHFRDEPARMCRPFDAARQGFVRGEGAAALVLEHPHAARRRGAPVLAEITGHGQRLDARRGTEPDADGQAAAMRAALATAGLEPADIDYVNAHGTGSVLGDTTEAASLTAVFGTRPSLRVNSTKPLTGHCLSAAGLIEAAATVAQLRAGTVHPNVNLERPDTAVPLAGRTAEHLPLRTALSNSFAFGGINASVVIRLPDPRP
ncbi:beta-ketoacyl synthase N-terminal-like domain-containing protein [Streptomyces pristinaespiralis]|uniref:Beta-ketoacyl-ACP synthase n=3 Tax=Streptomyces pristinaespiralis TaxID=38300 RepID=D9UBU9_STRPR|nr:beta-ketoacyl synthase N-terminal-like domain-containing protein [Streptomyces pristinaespiralis]ALC18603.1 beta-ketoacyl-ACP synthase [Streptomyces pristinaespiralis]ALC25362.1 beta-ketoacyl-ACP synthase [Streptomyces pristinaespiralis]CBW45746.1 beta-ketoacyl-ACP synthase [Streptomyces pristinaespiralis]